MAKDELREFEKGVKKVLDVIFYPARMVEKLIWKYLLKKFIDNWILFLVFAIVTQLLIISPYTYIYGTGLKVTSFIAQIFLIFLIILYINVANVPIEKLYLFDRSKGKKDVPFGIEILFPLFLLIVIFLDVFMLLDNIVYFLFQ